MLANPSHTYVTVKKPNPTHHAHILRPQPVKWSLVADLLPGRLGKQCRERWFNHLDPAVKKTGWTSDEDEVIFHAQVIVGHVFLTERGPNLQKQIGLTVM